MPKVDIEQWGDLITQANDYKKLFGDSENWPTYKEYYRGNFPSYNRSTSDGSILPYNITFSMARAMVPNIYMRNPYVSISPRYHPNLEMHAKVVEAIDNNLISELNIKRTLKSSIFDAYFCNRGIVKVGYDSQYGFAPKDVLSEMGLEDTTATQFSKDGKEALEYNVNVKPGMPWVVRVPPDSFLVPFGVRTLDDCVWADHMVIRMLEDVKKDVKYSSTKELEGTHFDKSILGKGNSRYYQELQKNTDWVEIHEIRDAKRREVLALVVGHDKYIMNPHRDVLQIEGLPFVDFSFNEDPDYYWGPSDCKIMEPQQLEMNEARTQAMYHRRLALIKFMYEEGGIEDAEVDKMLSEVVGVAVKCKGDPSKVISLLQPHIPPDLASWPNLIRADVREQMGFGRQQMGGESAGKRTTATESQIVQMAHELRMDERRDMVADALQSIIRKINQIIFTFWDEKHVVQVVGYDGAKYWVEYTKDMIKGEYLTKVDVESMTPATKALKKRDLVQLIQSLANHPTANLNYLIKMLLSEYDWIDALKVLPEAQETMGGPMGMPDYMKQQQGLLKSPERLKARSRQTARVVGGGA